MSLEVRTAQRIAAPIATVFEAFVDPEQMSGYFISAGTGRMAAGKTITWSFADHGGVELDIDVKQVEAPHSLSFVWSASGAPREVHVAFRAESPEVTEISVCEGPFDVEPDSVQRFGEQTQGWANMLACLKAYLEYGGINLRAVPAGTYACEIEKTLQAQPAAIYHAWTTGWGEWFALPDSVAVVAEVGAAFRFVTEGRGGERCPHHGRFLVLEPDRVVELGWVTEATRGRETTLRVELTADDERTRVRVRHAGFRDAASADAHGAAWPAVLGQLERSLRG